MSKSSVRQFWRQLGLLGFASYRDYLASPHWADVKRRYAESKLPKTCVVCDRPYQVLHHRTYKRLGAERLMDLIPLCHDHHGELHRQEARLSHVGLWGQTKGAIRRMRGSV